MLTTDQALAAARAHVRWYCPCGARLTMSREWMRNADPGVGKAAVESWNGGHKHLPGYRPSPLIRATRRIA
jgi:hypothetical protein